jgi:hypothetical protein
MRNETRAEIEPKTHDETKRAGIVNDVYDGSGNLASGWVRVAKVLRR